MTSSSKSRRNPSGCAKKFSRPTNGRGAGRKFGPATKRRAEPAASVCGAQPGLAVPRDYFRNLFMLAAFLVTRFCKQLLQVLLPHRGPGMSAVAARLVA